MRELLLVGGGGFVGSVLRYLLASAIGRASIGGAGVVDGAPRFPLGTLVVNVLGCLVIGGLAAVGQHHQPWSTGARLLLFTGLLGGFTTFSAFGYETFELARAGAMPLAGLNVALQLALGLAAVAAGYRAVALLAR